MASAFNDLSLNRSEQAKVKPPKGFGASAAVGTVVELSTNNQLGDATIYLEMFNKKGSAGTVTKKTVKNFLKYAKKGLYDNSIFHRSVPGFVLQGGGFSVPPVPAGDELIEQPRPITSFKSIKNQPGNSNFRGTVAMAKLGGDPDSATNQWFINLENNFNLDEQNGGFTAFGRVLGEGMEVVDQLASADVFPAGGPFAQLPLWELSEGSDGSAKILPDDFLTVISAQELKDKNHPFVLSVESSDDSLVKAKITKKQQLKLKTSSDTTGTAEITVEAISLIDGTVDVDSFDVVIGDAPQTRVLARSSKKRNKTIDVLVDAGSFDEPFYRFLDPNGDEYKNFKINVKKTYRFFRFGEVETHPFYVGDSGFNQKSSNALKIKGNGGFLDGITGSEVLTFQVRKSDRKAFKKEGVLSYFCTSHPSMIGTFSIKGQKGTPVPEPVQELVTESDFSSPVVDGSGGYYKVALDSVEQFPLI